MRAAADAGFPAPVPVAAQFAPDGHFPTVNFPNPEEPGAMDLAFAEAASVDADIIIANDPDADRAAAGIRTADGGYRMLTGDEIGSLLAWWTVERMRRSGAPMMGTMAESIVSGTLLRGIAEDAGLDYAATLTGFKWISKVPGLIFGYEEALGYCCDPAYVKDKDGITALLLTLEMAAHLAVEGGSLQDVLDDLALRFGLHVTSQVSVRVSDLHLIRDAMARLRTSPPRVLGGRPVSAVVDLEEGADGLPPTDGLRFTLAGARVIIRPSGTEPKLKCYLQIVVPVLGEDLVAARALADAEMASLRSSVTDILGLP
jgi:phosphomannomutase